MPFIVSIEKAKKIFPEYRFISCLTPSEQKAAFHVKDSNGTDLCLKIICPTYDVHRLQREVIALQSLSHPNIVKLLEYTFTSKIGNQRHFIIEEYIDGMDLHDLLTIKPWDLNKASQFFIQLFDGLFALNEKGLVHRDLKPKNIRVRADNTPVIIDFGLARHLLLSDITRTSEGAAIGTPNYFAPEQFFGNKHDIDHRTDLFASGIILYQALIGQHPFMNNVNTYNQLKDSICYSDDYKRNPTYILLPRNWQIIINKLLEKERSKRPLNGKQVANLISKI
ncbi:MAG: serine/threonine-protein kinase [Flavobacterium sp.]|jgi:serine/threonine protein kinase|nr:serine/threonine-protein kinase [Flavobacterium sp.]